MPPQRPLVPVQLVEAYLDRSLRAQKDFTFSIPLSGTKVEGLLHALGLIDNGSNRGNAESGDEPKRRYSYDGLLDLARPGSGKGNSVGRALACLCDKGSRLSITCRILGDPVDPDPGGTSAGTNARKLRSGSNKGVVQTYKPEGYKPVENAGGYLFSIKAVVDELYQIIGKLAQPNHHIGHTPEVENRQTAKWNGLLLITGRTNVAKSKIARGLIYQYLDTLRQQRGRRPHLVTYEDPIEATLELAEASGEARGMVDFTPREHGVDVECLESALLMDALRQTPSVFSVGEIRQRVDWAPTVRYAGTGHLVVATAHAGSLIEAISRVFEECKAETPAARGQIASRLLAVIHLASEANAVVPSIWVRTPQSVASLTSEGLSSVVPLSEFGCFGRADVLYRLLRTHKDSIGETERVNLPKLRQWALIQDLGG